jgi:hypothetical protein
MGHDLKRDPRTVERELGLPPEPDTPPLMDRFRGIDRPVVCGDCNHLDIDDSAAFRRLVIEATCDWLGIERTSRLGQHAAARVAEPQK